MTSFKIRIIRVPGEQVLPPDPEPTGWRQVTADEIRWLAYAEAHPYTYRKLKNLAL